MAEDGTKGIRVPGYQGVGIRIPGNQESRESEAGPSLAFGTPVRAGPNDTDRVLGE